MYIVVAAGAPSALDGHVTTNDSISVTIALLTGVGLGVVALRAFSAGSILERALSDTLGAGWRTEIDGQIAQRLRRRLPWHRILLWPFPFRPRLVERLSNIPYGDHGRDNLLDVYRHRAHPIGAPTLIFHHGGGFKRGRKSVEARPLIHRLALQGWTCISANYRLAATPAQGFPHHLVDAKKVIAWARTSGLEHGVDPDMIFMAGSSAGAHLTAMSALTVNDPALQPGFEAADSTIVAGIGLYGYYGSLGNDAHRPTSPVAYASASARPMFVIHGDHGTFTPVEGARRLVAELRAASTRVVVYAEHQEHSIPSTCSNRFASKVVSTRSKRLPHGYGARAAPPLSSAAAVARSRHPSRNVCRTAT